MAAQGRLIGSQAAKKQRTSNTGEKVVAPIKIRISARKKKRNDDDDDDNRLFFFVVFSLKASAAFVRFIYFYLQLVLCFFQRIVIKNLSISLRSTRSNLMRKKGRRKRERLDVPLQRKTPKGRRRAKKDTRFYIY